MQGRRVQPQNEDGTYIYSEFQPGDYFKVATDGNAFYAFTPNNHLSNLRAHSVTEHEDGTITVSPSILVSDGQKELWHGFLERGVWRSC